MSIVSRGFRGRRRNADADSARVPPGQYVTRDFPVLSAGPTPQTPLELDRRTLLPAGHLAGRLARGTRAGEAVARVGRETRGNSPRNADLDRLEIALNIL
jgi:hypothetical protein